MAMHQKIVHPARHVLRIPEDHSCLVHSTEFPLKDSAVSRYIPTTCGEPHSPIVHKTSRTCRHSLLMTSVKALPTRLNASSTNTPAANPRLICTAYQGIIPDQVSGSITRQSCRCKWLSCATHEDQDNQLLHTGSHIPFIYFDIHTSFHMYTLSTLGNFHLRITSFWSSPFPSEFESQSQFPSLFPASSSLSLSLISTTFSLHCVCILYCISLRALFVLLRLLRSASLHLVPLHSPFSSLHLAIDHVSIGLVLGVATLRPLYHHPSPLALIGI